VEIQATKCFSKNLETFHHKVQMAATWCDCNCRGYLFRSIKAGHNEFGGALSARGLSLDRFS